MSIQKICANKKNTTIALTAETTFAFLLFAGIGGGFGSDCGRRRIVVV
jgi:hypothetical protein